MWAQRIKRRRLFGLLAFRGFMASGDERWKLSLLRRCRHQFQLQTKYLIILVNVKNLVRGIS